jgi:hypothetical protein
MREQRGFRNQNTTLAALTPQRHAPTDGPTVKRDLETPGSTQETVRKDAARHEMARKWRNRNDRRNYYEAFCRHHREWHEHDWWHDHCNTIVFVTTGYYFLDGSYWYPAWGYDPVQTSYDYDGPIYTYNDLLPDEVIANVQVALQDAGYYLGAVTGSLSVEMRAALVNFQRDYGLPLTGAIDEATVQTLGLN